MSNADGDTEGMERIAHYYPPGFERRLSQATRLVAVLIVLIDMFLAKPTHLTDLMDLANLIDLT
jgi:hypothetical protein